MAFESIAALASRLRELGASRVLFKVLSENDNSKQQIYFGGSFNVLQVIPHGEIRSDLGVKRKNYKAPVELSWILSDGRVERASGAQLILYPDYPEVRLSGFLRGCSIAPTEIMKSLPRRHGRVLFLGIAASGAIYAYAAEEGSSIAAEAVRWKGRKHESDAASVFGEIEMLEEAHDSRGALLEHLWQLHREGWINGSRLDRTGKRIPCNSRNCGGYTLEAHFGIVPNGRSEPDYRGWELKAHSPGGRITLMTPEPTLGYYGENGVEKFVRRYGRQSAIDTHYFTGQHKVGVKNSSTKLTLEMSGYDRARNPRGEVDGSISLVESGGQVAAGWAFADLLSHWARKHTNAAYVPYISRSHDQRQYAFGRKIRLGVGTTFERYLHCLSMGVVKFDPGSKVEFGPSARIRVKARNQFRTVFSQLHCLYDSINDVLLPIDHARGE